jgi:type I restriction enzyme S subunit
MAGKQPIGWDEHRLRQLVEVFDGPHATPATVDEGPVFLGIQALQNGRLRLKDTRHVTDLDFAKWTKRVAPRDGDLVFSYETRLGEAALIPPGLRCCLGRRMGLLRIRENAPVEPRMLLFAFLGPQFQRVLRHHTIHGSTVDRLPIKGFGEFPIVLPGLEEQRAIVSVLGALDDKIESNEGLVTTLVELIDLAYHDAIRDASVSNLGALGTVVGGGTPKSSEPSFWTPEEVPWITPKDMTALAGTPVIWRGERSISMRGLSASSAKLMPAGSVLFTSRATLGVIAVAQQAVATNQGFISVVPADGLSSAFVYAALKDLSPAIEEQANGSTFMEVNKTNFKSVPCSMPSPEAHATFDRVASPALSNVTSLVSEARTLTSIRDALLPKLVSGQIRAPLSDDSSESLGAAVEAYERQEAMSR